MSESSFSTTGGNGGQVPNIISIELYDNSSFKFPVASATTPRMLIATMSKKVGLTQTDCFGLQCPRSLMLQSEVIALKLGKQSAAAPSDTDERVFLQDDLPIMDQMAIQKRGKMWLAMKYSFGNAKKELDDSKCLALICQEMSSRFKNHAEPVAKDILVSLITLQIHIKTLQSAAGSSHIEDVKSFAPKTPLINDGDFLEETLHAMRALEGVSYKDAAFRFLSATKQNFPQWFQTKFEATHIEPAVPIGITVSTSGLKFQLGDKPLLIPFKALSRWSMASLDDESASAHGSNGTRRGRSPSVISARNSKPEMNGTETTDMLKSIMSGSSTSLAVSIVDRTPSKPSGSRGSKFSMNGNATMSKKMTRADIDAWADTKTHRCTLTIHFVDTYFSCIEVTVFSTYINDFRLVELINEYSSRERINDVQMVDTILDDPQMSDTPITCIARADYVAKDDDELMFLKDEVITITEKLADGRYIGVCQGLQGVFSGANVYFQNGPREMEPSGARKSDGPGEIWNFYCGDDTRRSQMVTEQTTPQDLVQQLAAKIELADSDFFAIFEVGGEAGERCLRPNIPIVRQGVTAASKLVFKTRILYKDVAELFDPMTAYMYFLQVKEFVLSGVCPITENDAIDFVALQLQASLGDHDPERHKASSLGVISTLLPPQFQKMTLTRNETWWQKKFLAAHQQHRGISKTDAEKAYISLAQKLPLFGYQIFTPTAPENIHVGISRDWVVILDRTTKTIMEKYPNDAASVKWRNQSLVVELTLQPQSGAPEKICRLLTAQALEIIEVLWLLAGAEMRSVLRKKCKTIREKFGMLGVSLDYSLPAAGDKKLSDPELLAATLRNGVALQNLLPAIKRPFNPHDENVVYAGESMATNSTLLPNELSAEKIQSFTRSCMELYGVSGADLFEADQLLDFSLENFARVMSCLQKLFDSVPAAAKLNAISDHLKASKKRANGSNAPAAMSTEDFMRKVMDELVATESNYVKDLEKIVSQYIKPVLARMKMFQINNSGVKSPEEEVLDIFNNMDDIYYFHANMFERIEKIGADVKRVGELGQVFSELGDRFIPLYEQYCSGHSDSADRIPDLRNAPELMTVLGLNGDPQNDQVAMRNLSSQLIKPVQRIMRYHLLLKELLRYTPENNSGYQALDKALQKMKDVASAVNEIKRKKENELTLSNLQSRMEGYEGPPISSYGTLLQDGKMLMVEKAFLVSKSKFGTTKSDYSFSFFLFEEILLYCKEVKKGRNSTINGYKFKGVIPTAVLTVKEQVTDLTAEDGLDLKFSWELTRTDVQKGFVITSLTQEDKDRWIGAIAGCAKRAATRPPGERVNAEPAQDAARKFDSAARTKSYSISSAFRLNGGKKKETDRDDSSASIKSTNSVVAPVDSPPPMPPMPAIPPATPITATLARSFTFSTGFAGGSGDTKTQLQSLQDQTAALAKQCQDLQATIKTLGHENALLQSRLDKEQKTTRRLEVELATEKGRNDALEQIVTSACGGVPAALSRPQAALQTTGSTGSMPNIAAGADSMKPVTQQAKLPPPLQTQLRPIPHWSAQEKSQMMTHIVSDQKLKVELMEHMQSLNTMLKTMTQPATGTAAKRSQSGQV